VRESTDDVGGQAVERREHDVCEYEHVPRRWVATIRNRDDAHSGRARGAYPVPRVLHRSAAFGGHSEAPRGLQIDVRCGFAAFDLLRRHGHREQSVQARTSQHGLDDGPVRRGRDCERKVASELLDCLYGASDEWKLVPGIGTAFAERLRR
jgi:hypothetical protein